MHPQARSYVGIFSSARALVSRSSFVRNAARNIHATKIPWIFIMIIFSPLAARAKGRAELFRNMPREANRKWNHERRSAER